MTRPGSITCATVLVTTITTCTLLPWSIQTANAQARFGPPNINAPAREFNERFGEIPVNVPYVIARALGRASEATRDANEEAGGDPDNPDERVFDSRTDDGSAVSGSVVVSPGVTADEIIIININEGDSTSIRR